MKSNIHSLTLRSIPSTWTDSEGRTIHGYQNRTDLHYADGWRDYVAPVYDSATHKLSELIYDEEKDVVTRKVVKKTAEELEAERQAMIPFTITPTQGRIRLKQMNLLEQVVLLVKNSADEELQIYWEYALSWDRDNTFVRQMAFELGMTEDDLDNFYLTESLIK
jgi:hypothetical protein